jgi:hypothetical protein
VSKKIVAMRVTYRPGEIQPSGAQEVRIEVQISDQTFSVSKLFSVAHFQPMFDYLIADAVAEIKREVNRS